MRYAREVLLLFHRLNPGRCECFYKHTRPFSQPTGSTKERAETLSALIEQHPPLELGTFMLLYAASISIVDMTIDVAYLSSQRNASHHIRKRLYVTILLPQQRQSALNSAPSRYEPGCFGQFVSVSPALAHLVRIYQAETTG